MSRACSPGGRFTSDFEQKSISDGIDADLKNPVGTSALWYMYDDVNTVKDPIYDVGTNADSPVTNGRIWHGPYSIPIIRAIISQGSSKISQAGFYNADTLHLTLNSKDIEKLVPGVMTNPDDQNRSRVVWKNQVYRPFNVQQRGIISEDFTLLVIECQQVMPEEMVNDPQFLTFSDNPL
jgi:hypothetical protein